MRRPSLEGRFTIAGAALVLTLAAVVACASCGSTTSSGLGGGVGGSSGSSSGDNGGDDSGNSSGCTSGFCTTTSSSGGSLPIGDSGLPDAPSMVNSLVTQDECPGKISTTMYNALKAAGASSGSMKWLYPYDQTVFPGGLGSPVLQWSQTGTPDGVYIHLHSTLFDYQGCFAGSSPTNIGLPVTPWQTAWAQSKGKADPISVELATSTGGTIASSTTHWIFAKGSLAGDVYYNTYGSKLVPGVTAQNGAVMRIPKGGAQPQAFLYTTAGASPFGPCVSCHSLSANGSMLVAQQHFYPGGLNGKGSMSFDLTKTAMPNPMSPTASTLNDDWGLSAVYPDGTFLLTAGEPEDTSVNPIFPGVAGNNPGMLGPKPSVFYNTATGTSSTPTGLDTPYAMMPDFSPDGTLLVYNNNRGKEEGGASAGHTLAVANFTASTKAFSGVKQIFEDASKYPGWPFFTPDNKQVIFTLGNDNNFATEEPPGDLVLNSAYLYVVDVATGTSHRLDSTSGYSASGTEYLPFPGRDEGYDFYPTVNTVATGGYFWVYFTSRRSYGNVYPGNGGESDVGTKAIWVAAIDIGTAAGTDPSHPAFYLPGQELGSGNIRAFPTLAPCSGDGSSCETGLDCCGGACTTGKCGVPAGCSKDEEKCMTSANCCDRSESCLGGYCVATEPQ